MSLIFLVNCVSKSAEIIAVETQEVFNPGADEYWRTGIRNLQAQVIVCFYVVDLYYRILFE